MVALTRGINRWQRDVMAIPEPRLKASIVVPFEDAAASVAEIEALGPDKHYAQVFLLTRSREPLGNPRYCPIYAAAERYGLPVAFHVFGAGGHPYTGTGWPSHYIEEGAGHSTSCQTVVTSLVIEGVFERFPKLKAVIVEGGFGWLPALSWRLDKLYERMRSEVPHLKRKPSEYIRDHIYLSTQPMVEPDDRRHLNDVIDWIGADRLVFASDYPVVRLLMRLPSSASSAPAPSFATSTMQTFFSSELSQSPASSSSAASVFGPSACNAASVRVGFFGMCKCDRDCDAPHSV